MARYRITIKKSAAKELGGIPAKELRRITRRIRSLAENPRPQGCQKLSALQLYRIRQGDYKIVYTVSDEERIVDIIKIGHRREIYR